MRKLWLIGVVVALGSPLHAAVLMVTNTDNDGPGSLRDCVEQALPGDVVEFDPGLDGQVIQLGSQITIDKSVVIGGQGPETTVLQGRRVCGSYCWGNRVFEVPADKEVDL